MPARTGEVVVDAATLCDAIESILRANGAQGSDARAQASQLLEGELRNHPSHGLRRLPTLVARLRAGLLVSPSEAVRTWVSESVMKVDGMRGFGPSVAFDSLSGLMARAGTTGIAMATIHNTNHVGMLAPYVERMAAGGHIGLAFTISEALVHPWGGKRGFVGTNPIGLAVPTSTEPVVLDMSTSAVSMGKILDYAGRSLPIPEGWAIDERGAPTTDALSASRGALSPFGGPKGYGLGVALEAMVGVLSGSALGRDVRGTLDTTEVATKGDVFISISLECLGASPMLPLLDAYLADVRASGSSGEVLIPGDRSRQVRKERMEHGIPLDAALWDRTLAMLEEADHD